MLASDPFGEEDDHVRDLHLLVGRYRQGVRRSACPSAREAASRSTSSSTGSAARRWTKTRSKRCAGRRGNRAIPPAEVVHHRPHEQPHPSQAARRRRPDRFHRRRRHRGQVGRPRAGCRSLARHALPHRRPGGRADAGRFHGQLDQDHRQGAAHRRLLSAARSRSGTQSAQVFQSSIEGGAESMHLMYLLSIAAASEDDPSVDGVFRARRRRAATRWSTRCAAA